MLAPICIIESFIRALIVSRSIRKAHRVARLRSLHLDHMVLAVLEERDRVVAEYEQQHCR
ncbi:MAG: hypothetical protein AAGI37_12590 [Planctomycetota bacterium]